MVSERTGGVTPAEGLTVAGLLGASFLLRRIALYWIPVFVHNDEVSVLLEGRKFLGPNPPGLFATGWYGCPNLGLALNGVWLRLFGNDLMGGRLASMVLGIFSLLGAWWLTRLLFGRRPALLALVVLVPWHWHVQLSRSAHHYVQAVAFGTWALALAAAGLRSRKLGWFVASGALLGVALQTYYSARLLPLLVTAWIAVWALEAPQDRRRAATGLVVTALSALAVCAPLIPHYMEHPSDFNLRTRDVFVFSPLVRDHVRDVIGVEPTVPVVLAYQLRRIGGFLFRGPDAAVQYGHVGPFLDPFLWVPFLAGVLLLVARWRKPESWLPLLWISGTMVIGGILTIDPPFSPRLSIMVTAIPMVVAVGFEAALSLRARGAPWRLVITAVMAALLAGSWAWNVEDYFVRFPLIRHGRRRDRIVRLLEGHPGTRSIVNLYDQPEDFAYRSYAFAAPDARGINLGCSAERRASAGPDAIRTVGVTRRKIGTIATEIGRLQPPILVVGPRANQLAALYRRAGSGEWRILWDPWARRPLPWLWLDRGLPARPRAEDPVAPRGQAAVAMPCREPPLSSSPSSGRGLPRSRP